MFSDQLASQILLRCSETARSRSFGEQLVTEICYLALYEAHTYQVGLGGSLEFLVSHGSGAEGAPGTRLVAVLAEVADSDFRKAVLVVINSMHAMAGQAIVERVRAAWTRGEKRSKMPES